MGCVVSGVEWARCSLACLSCLGRSVPVSKYIACEKACVRWWSSRPSPELRSAVRAHELACHCQRRCWTRACCLARVVSMWAMRRSVQSTHWVGIVFE